MPWHRLPSRLGLLLVVAVAVLAVGGRYVWQRLTSHEPLPDPANRFALPPLSSSPFLNTSAEAEYVGIQPCADCHAGKHRTWQHTSHSRALSNLDLAAEPPNSRFTHAASGQTYSVYRRHAQLHHRATTRDEQGDLVVEDHAVRYLIGSGHHTRSYLVEEDGFLFESPLTWYVSRHSWGMSPGYDQASHYGFERAVEGDCLFCHAGRLSSAQADYQRVRFAEMPIGCERCHGPGSLHVEEERAIRAGQKQVKERRPTIVNPAGLNRERREAICAQCHLNADSEVVLRSRSMTDFRPGLPLSDFCVSYRLDEAASQMKVVGHVEQLHLSRCYQASQKLTCTTCHDPHSPNGPEEARQISRQTCLSCHGEAGCRLPRDRRLARSPANDCLVCHMPKVDTDIEHVAFTHHRIGVHSPGSSPPATRTGRFPDLVPLDEPALSPLDRDRNLGLAYFGLAQRQPDRAAVAAYQERALHLLTGVSSQGLPDGEAAAVLAHLSRQADPLSAKTTDAALDLAHAALRDEHLSAKATTVALVLIANVSLQRGHLEAAEEAVERLIRLRRRAQDWLMLSLCRQGRGDWPGALRALEQAAVIAPFRPDIRDHLAGAYEQMGHREAAERERLIGRRLMGLIRSLPSQPNPK